MPGLQTLAEIRVATAVVMVVATAVGATVVTDPAYVAKETQAVMVSATPQRSLSPRAVGLVIAVFLSWPLIFTARSSWTNYWLLTDGQQGFATVTRDAWTGHNVVLYQYNVNGQPYSGEGRRNWRDPKYAYVLAGEKSSLYYSRSHPWLSRLDQPDAIVEGLPVILLMLLFEFFAVTTIIKPTSRWAFRFSGANGLPAKVSRA